MLPCSSGVCTPDQGSGASACLDTGGRGACPPGEAAQREDRKQQGPGGAHVPGEGLAKTGLQHRGQQGIVTYLECNPDNGKILIFISNQGYLVIVYKLHGFSAEVICLV